MPEERKLQDIFKKYIPTDSEERRIFDNSSSASLSGDREKKMYQVRFCLPFTVAKSVLYKLEQNIAEAYELTYIRLLPK
ncbi:MAG: hypothetical protein PUC29_04485, partial [Clostridia bacterium]|nr:hypothetical protein [Clostridia bacterium]